MKELSAAAIQCKDLVKLYRQGERTIYAVNNCGIRIDRGEFAVITGKSGSGKSTLLNLFAGYTKPTQGAVFVNGQELGRMNDREISRFRSCDIGFIFQSFCLFPILTAKENILFPLYDRRKFSRVYFEELCGILDIADRLDHLPGELSGGQQQRVAIARALINRPGILLADEPTGNLDKASAEALVEYLLKIHRSYGTTLVIVTHDPELAGRAEKLYEVENGIVRLGQIV